MAWISWGSEFHSFGAAAIWNDLSPNVTFVIIDGAASKTQALRTLRFQEVKVFDVKRGYATYRVKSKQQYLEMDTLSYREKMQIPH